MIRPLGQGDTPDALALLRPRPIHNVFLEYVVRSGALGSLPGFTGYFAGKTLEGIVLVAPGGGVAVSSSGVEPPRALGEAIARQPIPARHIVGPEEFTVPFFHGYAPSGASPIWERREPVYVVTAETLCSDGSVPLVPAEKDDLEPLVRNSAEQYREDLHDDRFASDPEGFRERHRRDVGQRRWWILRENGDVVFQVHVGPENDRVVQIGGVFTVPERRNSGVATAGVASIARELLTHRPAVSLFCDEANGAARRVYERVGFEARFHYRSWLLETGGSPG
ncbi:MAG: GNAT family N-acetyltransferase [Myxococcota bacterium]